MRYTPEFHFDSSGRAFPYKLAQEAIWVHMHLCRKTKSSTSDFSRILVIVQCEAYDIRRTNSDRRASRTARSRHNAAHLVIARLHTCIFRATAVWHARAVLTAFEVTVRKVAEKPFFPSSSLNRYATGSSKEPVNRLLYSSRKNAQFVAISPLSKSSPKHLYNAGRKARLPSCYCAFG